MESSTPPDQLRSSSCCSSSSLSEESAAVKSDISNLLYSALHFLDPFFHLLDLFVLTQTCRRIHDRVNIISSDRFRSLHVHGLESTSSELDIAFSDFVICSPRRDTVERVLFRNGRFARATDLILFNFDESRDVFLTCLVPNMMCIKALKLYNCTHFDFPLSGCASSLTSLFIGLNDPAMTIEENQFELRLPHLRVLEIVGFPITRKSLGWLMKLLSFVSGLRQLRLNCFESEDNIDDMESVEWNTNSLLSVEVVGLTEVVKNIQPFAKLTEILFKSTASFPKLHTITLTCGIPDSILAKLSESINLVHVVVTNCRPNINLKLFAAFLKSNFMNLQTLVIKFSGKCDEHLDSIVQLILNSGSASKQKSAIPLPPLERLEIEVQVDPFTGTMEPPYHSIRGLTTLRCRYRFNLYFKRSRFGFSMAGQRFQCTDKEPPNVASPMELFGEEMVEGVSTSPEANEGEVIYEWNAIGKIQRGIYVEIFEEYVERELRFNDDCATGKLDVAATIANLRE
jgi:hypothetical protein